MVAILTTMPAQDRHVLMQKLGFHLVGLTNRYRKLWRTILPFKLQRPPEYEFFNTMMQQLELARPTGGLAVQKLTDSDENVRLDTALATQALHVMDGRPHDDDYDGALVFQGPLKQMHMTDADELRECIQLMIEAVLWLGLRIHDTVPAPVKLQAGRNQGTYPLSEASMIVANPEAPATGRVQVLVPGLGSTADTKELVWMLQPNEAIEIDL